MDLNSQSFQNFIDNIPCGIYSFDLEGKLLFTNFFIEDLIKKHSLNLNFLLSITSILNEIKNNIESNVIEIELHKNINRFFKNHWKLCEIDGQKIIQGTIVEITNLKLTQDELKESQNKFTELFNNIAQGILYQNKEGLIYDANPAAERILGLSRDQLIGKSPNNANWKAIHEDGREYKENDNPAVYTLKTGKPLHGAMVGLFNKIKQNLIWILVSTIPRLIDKNGLPNEVLTTFEDITDLRKWQIALSQSEERYRRLFNSATDFIFLKDSNYRYLMINKAYEDFLGISENDAIGRSDFELLSDDMANKFYVLDQKALSSGTNVYSYETVYDKIYEVQKFSVPLSETEVGIGGIIKDVTEFFDTQRKIKENEEKYRIIVDNQTDLIVKVDKDGKFLFVSPSYCSMFGKREEELLGKRFIPLVHPEDRENTLKEMGKLYSPPYTCYIEQRALTVNGWKWLGWIDKAITDTEGNVIEIIGTGRDITDKKELEHELRKAKEVIEQKNKNT
jgi:PAS domain S-box-containing protein